MNNLENKLNNDLEEIVNQMNKFHHTITLDYDDDYKMELYSQTDELLNAINNFRKTYENIIKEGNEKMKKFELNVITRKYDHDFEKCKDEEYIHYKATNLDKLNEIQENVKDIDTLWIGYQLDVENHEKGFGKRVIKGKDFSEYFINLILE